MIMGEFGGEARARIDKWMVETAKLRSGSRDTDDRLFIAEYDELKRQVFSSKMNRVELNRLYSEIGEDEMKHMTMEKVWEAYGGETKLNLYA
eukprot:CAMPEP_0168611972 /NCGR_PEP_ID=MMETSP0449_2-20121227/2654_1 /TAXON_ID=1082188 /ORGANISM="Strombidium rassoulzadegani, Strain ras09" /LENGTH=91 /DNA_ID=CAMNT_0008652477 /DNA_START=19 /DNA_END=294 /DNA_ORIENTATION=+